MWTELHASILEQLFTDPLPVPPELVAKYRHLPDDFGPADLVAINAALNQPVDRTRLVDGRHVVMGIGARIISEMVFGMIAKLTEQKSL